MGGMLVCLALVPATALADLSPCNDQAPKTNHHVLANPASDRAGGETILDATPIGALPFTDTGATCDNVHDYDEVCPYEDSTAPDVVYSLNLQVNITVDIDLGGSEYDTKVYVYDEDLELVACNDDYHADYTSKIEGVDLVARMTYYVVVDGYGEDCGAYTLTIDEYEECVVMCPPGAYLEGEPPIVDDYEDLYNGGCCGSDIPEHPFQELPGRANGEQVLCARSGWYLYQGAPLRDTDWFTIVIGPSGTVTIRGDADCETYLFELGPQDCASVGVVQNVPIGPCQEATMTVTGEPGSEVWLWTGPTTFEPPGGFEGNEYGYVLWLEGLAPATLTGIPDGAVVPSQWSTVKDLFD
jgi:hypothetical protein